jgi:hypothetical protein
MTFTVRAAREGGWFAFVADGRMLVAAAADDAFVTAAWSAVQGPDGFRAALDVLTGRGLTATPAFVLADWGAEPRVIVRGEVSVTVTDADGNRELSAAGVATWIEQAVPGATALNVTVPGAVDASAPALPLVSGVAFVASVVCGSAPATMVPPDAVAKPVESAAATPPPAAVRTAVPAREPAAAPAPATAVATPEPAASVPEPTSPPTRSSTQAAPRASAPIESTLAALPEQDAATAAEPASDNGYDYLFGETMYRSVSDAAVHAVEVEAEADAESTPEPNSGDHDGHTVLTSDLAKLRGRRKPRGRASAKPAAAADLVVVVSTTGAREPLTQPILVGRSPTVSQVPGGSLPRILAVDNNDHDVSRNHAQLALEGGTPVVTDLHSRNGTTIVMPGKKPQKLRAGEPTTVLVGTVVDFGGGLTLTIEEA